MAKDDMFKADLKDMQKFRRRLMLLHQKEFPEIERAVVNDMAFLAMKVARKIVMPRMFNIRSKWVQSSVMVDKAKRNELFPVAVVGAKSRWSKNLKSPFYGLRDQEMGTTIKDPDIPTEKDARIAGSFSRNVQAKKKWNKLGLMVKPANSKNVVRAIRIAQRLDKNVFITKNTKLNSGKVLKKGVYGFKGKGELQNRRRKKGARKMKRRRRTSNFRIRPLRMIKDHSKTTARIKPKTWLLESTKRASRPAMIKRMYKKNADRILKKR